MTFLGWWVHLTFSKVVNVTNATIGDQIWSQRGWMCDPIYTYMYIYIYHLAWMQPLKCLGFCHLLFRGTIHYTQTWTLMLLGFATLWCEWKKWTKHILKKWWLIYYGRIRKESNLKSKHLCYQPGFLSNNHNEMSQPSCTWLWGWSLTLL